MRRFITKTIYFSLPILVAAIIFEILLRNIPNEYLFKKKYLDDHSAEIETLILGSSHSYYGLNPDFFSVKAFNASHVSQSLNYDFEILKKYQFNFNNLKTIILPISYITLFAKLDAGSESWRVKNYVIYYGMNVSKSFIDYSEVLRMRIRVNLKRLVSYYVLRNLNITCTKLGWGTSYKSENALDLVESGKISAQRHTREDINSDKYQDIFKDNKLILNSIIKWCGERNIKILLLMPPAFETYRQNLNNAQLNCTIETTRQIAAKYNNCIYLNLLGDTNFIAKDFYDADHLSEIGAAKLSTLINDKINEWK